MQFVKVDEEVAAVELSFDTLERIANAFEVMPQGDERDGVLAKSFRNAHSRLTETEESTDSE